MRFCPHRQRHKLFVWVVLLAIGGSAVLAFGPSAFRGHAQRLQLDPCFKPPPADFGPFDDSFVAGRDPWILVRGPANRLAPVRATIDRVGQSVPIRLNDGSRGTLRVASRPCAPPEDCDPQACFNASESYWIEVSNAAGRRVAQSHFCGPYQYFQVVPVDLVGGRGDEVLLIRSRGHASPPIGEELKIWALNDSKAKVVLSEQQVSGGFGTMPINCARWRSRLLIDMEQRKPRSIRLQARFGARPSCQICDDASIAAVRRARVLRFDARRGQYDTFTLWTVR